LYDNDYKLLAENCLTFLLDHGINRFILICENVFHAYFETDDYYEALQEELDEGWITLVRPRQNVLEELASYNLSHYFYHSPMLDELNWRKFKPYQLFALIESRITRLLKE